MGAEDNYRMMIIWDDLVHGASRDDNRRDDVRSVSYESNPSDRQRNKVVGCVRGHTVVTSSRREGQEKLLIYLTGSLSRGFWF